MKETESNDKVTKKKNLEENSQMTMKSRIKLERYTYWNQDLDFYASRYVDEHEITNFSTLNFAIKM